MRDFFKVNIGLLLTYVVTSLVSCIVFFAFNYSGEVLLYLLGLSLFLVLILMYFRYLRYKSLLQENEFKIFEKYKLNIKNLERYKELQEEILKLELENQRGLRELNSYLTMWAHQVKTPLASISLIAERNGDSSVELEVQKTQEYISQMINFMKSRESSKDYSFKKVSLEAVVRKTIRKYRLFFIEKRLKLELEIEDVTIITDPKWFSFVLDQIVFNSLKYTKEGYIKVSNKEDKNILVIEDTGIGIPKEDLPRVKNFGFTGENGRNYANSTGIGLYLVDDILGKLKYDYVIESEVGKGTRFKINLNRRELIED